MLIVCHLQYCFETPDAAKEYFRRAWRFLSENPLMRATEGVAKLTSRAGLYRKVSNLILAPFCLYFQITQKEINDAPTIGQQCRVFQTSHRSAMQINKGLQPSDSVIYVFRVDSVVTKLVLCARAGQVCSW